MVTTTELVLLVLLLAVLLLAVRVLRLVKPFVVNAVVGLLVLLFASYAGLGLEISAMVVLICAVGGVPGALVVVALAYLDVAFVASVAPQVALALP